MESNRLLIGGLSARYRHSTPGFTAQNLKVQGSRHKVVRFNYFKVERGKIVRITGRQKCRPNDPAKVKFVRFSSGDLRGFPFGGHSFRLKFLHPCATTNVCEQGYFYEGVRAGRQGGAPQAM